MIKSINLQKILILLFPIALISGPLIPEIIIFFSLSLYFFITPKKEIIDDLCNKIFIFCFVFYIYILFSSLLNFASDKSLITSIFFIRFPIFSIIIFKLLESDDLFRKRLFFIILFLFLFLFIDSSFQIIFEKNIFGFELIADRASSLFGDELVLGSYLVKFSPILFGLLLFYKDLNKFFFLIVPISLFTILISGERTAFITSLLLCIFIISLIKFYKKKYFVLSFIFWLVLAFSSQGIQERYYDDIKRKFLKYDNIYFPYEYTGFILSSYEQFKNNPIIGGGVRSFRVNCKNTLLNFKLNKENVKLERRHELEKYIIDAKCSTHPHNIFLEFASELGLIGLLFLLFKFFYILKIFFYYYLKNINSYKLNNISNLIFILSPVLIVFPFLPSGSFFNNWNLSIYFLNIGFFIYACKKQKS